MLLVGAVLLAGCGGGGDSSSSASSASSESSDSSASTEQAQEARAEGGSSSQAPSPSSSSSKSNPNKQNAGSPASSPGATKHGQHAVLPRPGAKPEPTPTPSERAEATLASMTLSSPSLGAPGEAGTFSLPAKHTCAGADTWPALRWTGVPGEAKELILLVLAQEPVNGSLFYDWGVAGIDPATTEIQSGELPAGTVVGTNSFGKAGYSICPKGGAENYLFELYAVPESIPAAKGFDVAAMHDRVLQASGNVGLLAVVAG